ncbi:MAG: ATP-binding protein [Armatimonadetes bacterium]|nr:ATP-binding protein [Armatimonadota bacterium]
MLLEFSVANFRSFNEKQNLSFIASRDRHNAENIYGEKPRVLKSIAIFGANASGKSNLVKAVEFMEWMVTNSATKLNLGDPIPGVIPFKLRSDTAHQPSSFEVVLLLNGIQYRYGFSATTERVFDEWLWVKKPHTREVQWLERKYSAETATYSYECHGDLTKHKALLSERTRPNCLALSSGVQQNIEVLLPVYSWFQQEMGCLDFAISPSDLMLQTAKKCFNAGVKERVAKMLQDIDVQITEVEIRIQPSPLPVLSEDTPTMHLMKMIEKLDSGTDLTPLKVQTQHLAVDTNEPVWFDISDESNGTQRFFAVAGVLLEALDRGQVVFIDEFECNMHPRLAQRLIAWFQHPDINKTGAQLVVTTHDSTLMHPNLLRRDQIWLAEKDASSATTLYSLNDLDDDKKGRSTEIFQRHYLAGEYGGVPLFGRTFEEPRMP